MVTFAQIFVLCLNSAVFAVSEDKKPPRPTEGVEASDPDFGTSDEVPAGTMPAQSAISLIRNVSCSITDAGSSIALTGETYACQISDQVAIMIYLEKWDGSQWAIVTSWNYNEFDDVSALIGRNAAYIPGNYYRNYAVGYVRDGAAYEYLSVSSSYIYMD
jgi:hypothetical protein